LIQIRPDRNVIDCPPAPLSWTRHVFGRKSDAAAFAAGVHAREDLEDRRRDAADRRADEDVVVRTADWIFALNSGRIAPDVKLSRRR